MTKVDIISGFLGAGKTTLIKKLMETFAGEKLVLIENEYGEIGVDEGFLREFDVQISEINSGCICCSLAGDFSAALHEVLERYSPDRVVIEPSGVGKLSEVIATVESIAQKEPGVVLSGAVTVVDATKCKMHMRNFGEFYNDQVVHAGTIIFSRTQKLDEKKLAAAVELLREKNEHAAMITTPWDELNGDQILEAIERKNAMAEKLMEDVKKEQVHQHEHGENCTCGCHDHEHHDHEHHHHEHHDHEHHGHHEHGEHCHHHEHHGHHDHHEHGEHCHHHEHHDHHEHHHHEHHGHHHHHHHHHSADEAFTSWGVETPKTFTQAELVSKMDDLDSGRYGTVLRAKGIVAAADGKWLHFDYVPQEHEVRYGGAEYTGKLCVIGSELDEAGLKSLFGV